MLVAGPGPEEAGEPLVVQHQVPPEAQPSHHLLVLDQPLEARAHWGKIFIHEKLPMQLYKTKLCCTSQLIDALLNAEILHKSNQFHAFVVNRCVVEGSVLDPDPGGSVFKSPPGSGSVFDIRIRIQQGILSYEK